jgi:protein transport protein SEC24
VFVGGRCIIFSALLGTSGSGKLKARDDAKLYNTDKERTLYTLQDESYFNLAREATDAGMCVDLFACTHQYIDMSTNGAITAITGGSVFYHPRFSSATDGERLHYEFLRLMTTRLGMQAVMRARVSKGVSISDYFGNYTRKSPTDIEVGGVDSDKAFTIMLKHDEKLKEEVPVQLQFGMLYVDQLGRRLIRVFNVIARVSGSVMAIFRDADVNTIANVYAKRSLV